MSNGTYIHGMTKVSFNYLPFHEEYENSRCISLLSYCKRHRRVSDQCITVQDSIGACRQLDYIPSPSPSGIARTELYNYLGRIGRKQPQSYETVSLRRSGNVLPPPEDEPFTDSSAFAEKPIVESDIKPNCHSRMITVNGDENVIIFAKRDMEQWEELTYNYRRYGNVLPPPEDEPFSYSSASVEKPIMESDIQGAGTYMFQIDDHRIIDATKAGNIAHLMNHSCEPNCYSRIITVNGDEHVIIFAKRDIEQLEELTYNYRFSSVDEQLACYCGASRCRGVVNDIKAVEQVAKICVPCSEFDSTERG